MSRPASSIRDRVLRLCVIEDDHWIWKGAVVRKRGGTGHFSITPQMKIDGKVVNPVRALFGPIPKGTYLVRDRSICRHPYCVNPDHFVPSDDRLAYRRAFGAEWQELQTPAAPAAPPPSDEIQELAAEINRLYASSPVTLSDLSQSFGQDFTPAEILSAIELAGLTDKLLIQEVPGS